MTFSCNNPVVVCLYHQVSNVPMLKTQDRNQSIKYEQLNTILKQI